VAALLPSVLSLIVGFVLFFLLAAIYGGGFELYRTILQRCGLVRFSRGSHVFRLTKQWSESLPGATFTP
jgi:hypothetical protein